MNTDEATHLQAQAISLILGDVSEEQAYRVLTCLRREETKPPTGYGEEITVAPDHLSLRLNLDVGKLTAEAAREVEKVMRFAGQDAIYLLRRWLPLYNANRRRPTGSLALAPDSGCIPTGR